jgi:hypothetical protein
MSTPSKPSGTGLLSTIRSVAAAAFGVQSNANRERDFKQGKASHFIIAGILGTVIFLLLIGLLVKVVISLHS